MTIYVASLVIHGTVQLNPTPIGRFLRGDGATIVFTIRPDVSDGAGIIAHDGVAACVSQGSIVNQPVSGLFAPGDGFCLKSSCERSYCDGESCANCRPETGCIEVNFTTANKSATGTSAATHAMAGFTAMGRAAAAAPSSAAGGPVATAARYISEGEYLVQANEESVVPSGSVVGFARKKNHNAAWLRAVGRHIHQDSIQGNPSYSIRTWGGALGYDYMGEGGMVGGALSYLHSFIKEAEDAGTGIVNYAIGGVRGNVHLPRSLYFEYGLAGSVNFNHFKRNVHFLTRTETAQSVFRSYSLDPHFDLGHDYEYQNWCVIEPFVSADFIFMFQEAYDEYGAPGFDIHQNAHNAGVFRLEPGINYFQYWTGDWGAVILREKTSYIRKQPMYGSSSTISVLANPGDVIVGSGLIGYNLFAVSGQIFSRFRRGIFLSATYRGEWGSGFSLNELHARIGKYF